ncbi:MAG: alginate export family protein [Gemmatimonadales bacterium]
MTRGLRPWLAALLLAVPAGVGAQPAAAPGFSWTASFRTRAEGWDWFGSGSDGRYAYSGSLLRAGITWQGSGVLLRAEAAAPMLLGLPADALTPAPAGALGLGAVYYGANDVRRDVASAFLKNAWVQVGRASGHRLRVGRMEFADGAEATPASPTLAAVKRDRVAQRLLGPFGWSHVGRSFDGVLYGYSRGRSNLALLGARATRGAFDTKGWDGLEVGVGYASLTVAGPWDPGRSDLRLFGLYYRDDRRLPKVDSRPAAVRSADSTEVSFTVLGGHVLQEFATRAGTVDLLGWGAIQAGDWGRQSHLAWSAAIEAGIQPAILPALQPWLRAGVHRASGDADPGDDRHGTWLPVLPTPRIYARHPFYTTMNLDEVFASLLLRPDPALTLRSDLRAIRLAERNDLWYAGGGAFEPGTFGYTGRPGGNARDLATTLDLGAEWKTAPWITLTGYAAHAGGGEVVRSTWGDSINGAFGYLEVDLRYGAPTPSASAPLR